MVLGADKIFDEIDTVSAGVQRLNATTRTARVNRQVYKQLVDKSGINDIIIVKMHKVIKDMI